jgi:Leucine Rich repeat
MSRSRRRDRRLTHVWGVSNQSEQRPPHPPTPITPRYRQGKKGTSSQIRRYIHDEQELGLSTRDLIGTATIGDEEAKQIAKELVTNTTLKKLNLYRNGIGDDGTVALASLIHLRLHKNYIGSVGMEALGQALIHNDYSGGLVGTA